MMNGRHLPAGQGQGMPPDVGRRRHFQNPQYVQHYNPYMNPYNNAPYYPPQQYHPQYYNPGIHPQYSPYPPPPPHIRSPPPNHHNQYIPPQIPQPQPSYSRPHQSPATSAPYTVPPQAPSSTHSSHAIPVPSTPPIPHTPQVSLSVAHSTPPVKEAPKEPFRAPLPWSSHPDESWPARRSRRKRKVATPLSAIAVKLPEIHQATQAVEEISSAEPRPETPSNSQPPSEDATSTNPTTPSSAQQVLPVKGDTTPVASKAPQKPAIPAIPLRPAVPKAVAKEILIPTSEKAEDGKQPEHGEASQEKSTIRLPLLEDTQADESAPAPPPPKAWSQPKAWVGLFKPGPPTSTAINDTGRSAAPSYGQANADSLSEALKSFNAEANDAKVTFIEPRGLVNTGNMCYMNSVLQVLIFCSPFYKFLDQVSKRAVHSFKSDTPLIDAMIMFLREFPVIDSATSVEQLRLRLKDVELEQYGDSFTPDFVYDVINRLPRFSSMRRGHQQDAEEFLGFLLEGLHDECVRVIKTASSNNSSTLATPTNGPSSPISDVASSTGKTETAWLEVGRKQKAATTQSSGNTEDSPVTNIFGGKLRSELRVPGLKDSVTQEPYQPLQLDIGALNVNNIVDALKALTRSETLHGDFKSPKGPNVTAIKQVFIETVPPVLVLHLKRFQYDNTGGTQKIWKKVGYPLELELPAEVFPRKKRSALSISPEGFPKYRLIGVVYHHGKNASGGHYTVDVRRQDGREWIRLDDTVIRRIRSEDVAEAGSEEDPKVLAAAMEASQKKDNTSAYPFAAIDDEQTDTEGWKQASGPGKKWSSVVNGASTPKGKSQNDRSSLKDNKVAYLLFYQKI